jgi:hypothetical protein
LSAGSTFWILVEVALDHPIAPDPDDPEDSGDAVGYIQSFGVTAATEGEACELVEGAVVWETRASVIRSAGTRRSTSPWLVSSIWSTSSVA